MALVTKSLQDGAAAGDGANAERSIIFDDYEEDYQQAYWIYWGAGFASVITFVFSLAATVDDSWISFEGRDELAVGEHCGFNDSVCTRYIAAGFIQIGATIWVSLAILMVVIAAFTSPPTTGRLGLAAGIMLAVFSVLQMIAFSLMASAVSEFEEANVESGPTLGVAVMAWLFGLAGSITILLLRKRVTREQEGPFRKCMSGGGGTSGRGPMGYNAGAV